MWREVAILRTNLPFTVERVTSADGEFFVRKRVVTASASGFACELYRDMSEGPLGMPPDRDIVRTDAIHALDREATILQSLSHPCLPRVVDRGIDWFLMEHLSGRLLDRRLREEHGHPARARTLFASLVACLDHVHSHDVVHADIKPAHVLFRNDLPVLIDFGSALVSSTDPCSSPFADSGTPAWMAPERREGERASKAADIWSLCATMMWLGGARGFDEDPEFAELLRSGLGPAGTRPAAATYLRLMADDPR